METIDSSDNSDEDEMTRAKTLAEEACLQRERVEVDLSLEYFEIALNFPRVDRLLHRRKH